MTFAVIARHWPPLSPQHRKEAAWLLGRYGDDHDQPTIIMGELSGTASGAHRPRLDWTTASSRARDSKARRLPDGRWVDATDAVDHLIGWRDPNYHPDRRQDEPAGGRVDGCGCWALPEIAHATGPPDHRRVHTNGQRQRCRRRRRADHRPMPGSCRIGVPHSRHHGRWDSDYRLGEATFDLAASPGGMPFTSVTLARRYRLAA